MKLPRCVTWESRERCAAPPDSEQLMPSCREATRCLDAIASAKRTNVDHPFRGEHISRRNRRDTGADLPACRRRPDLRQPGSGVGRTGCGRKSQRQGLAGRRLGRGLPGKPVTRANAERTGARRHAHVWPGCSARRLARGQMSETSALTPRGAGASAPDRP